MGTKIKIKPEYDKTMMKELSEKFRWQAPAILR